MNSYFCICLCLLKFKKSRGVIRWVLVGSLWILYRLKNPWWKWNNRKVPKIHCSRVGKISKKLACLLFESGRSKKVPVPLLCARGTRKNLLSLLPNFDGTASKKIVSGNFLPFFSYFELWEFFLVVHSFWNSFWHRAFFVPSTISTKKDLFYDSTIIYGGGGVRANLARYFNDLMGCKLHKICGGPYCNLRKWY